MRRARGPRPEPGKQGNEWEAGTGEALGLLIGTRLRLGPGPKVLRPQGNKRLQEPGKQGDVLGYGSCFRVGKQ